MNESELYKELGVLTKEKDKWEESIPYVSSLLSHDSVKIKAKALWPTARALFFYSTIHKQRNKEVHFRKILYAPFLYQGRRGGNL